MPESKVQSAVINDTRPFKDRKPLGKYKNFINKVEIKEIIFNIVN